MKDKEPFFIDTNVLVYSIYGTPEQKEKLGLLLESQAGLAIISIQVLKEFTNISYKKKFHKTADELKQHLRQAIRSFSVSDITPETIFEAIDLKEQYQLAFYDSLIIATALENNCTTLYTEDLQHEQIIKKKLKIVNPFK
jgi:predicted nucleic acid-binding protein